MSERRAAGRGCSLLLARLREPVVRRAHGAGSRRELPGTAGNRREPRSQGPPSRLSPRGLRPPPRGHSPLLTLNGRKYVYGDISSSSALLVHLTCEMRRDML
ncbi:hypothetical protein AGIG_G18363 [Arapaima gigas]